MSKIAIITDSNSGITQVLAKEMGVFVIPMPFMIDGKEYEEDINLSQEQFYELLLSNSLVSTTQPSPQTVMDYWDEALKTYDEVVYIPMSSGLSGSLQTAKMLEQEDAYEGKVFVVNNQRISVTQLSSVKDAILLAEKGYSGKEIRDALEADKLEASIYITLDTLNYLKSGGRMTSAVAAIGSMLKIKPVLQIQGDKLDAFGIARTISQAKSQMINQVSKDIVNRFGGTPTGKGVVLYAVHSHNEEASIVLMNELKEKFPEAEVVNDKLSLSVSCHIGPGSLAIACVKKSFV